jgi:hypothetical protein
MSLHHQSSGQRRAQPRANAKLSAYQTAGNAGAPLTLTDTPSHIRQARWGCIAILVVFVVVAAMIAVIEIRAHEPPRLFPPIQEDLKLSGPLNGRFTTAITVEGMTSKFPPQQGEYGLGRVNATACIRNSDGWEIDLYGQVGAHPMSLSFDGDSTSSMSSADPYVGKHKLDNDPRFGGTVAFYWGSLEADPDGLGVEAGTLLVNPDGHSGMMNINLDTGTKKQEIITGSWRCA